MSSHISNDDTMAVGAKNVRMRSRVSYVALRRAIARKHPNGSAF
jgi:hypothetical protein